MNYGCEDTAEALAAYALDALPQAERSSLVEHLAECRRHDEELAGYRVVTGRLPLLLTAEAQPPPRLRDGLLAAFDREHAAAPSEPEVASETTAPAARPLRPPQAGSLLAVFRQASLAYGIAAAFLIAVLALGAWNLSLRDNQDVMKTVAAGPGMRIDVTYYPEQHVVVFDVDMPSPPSGRVYQAWMLADGKPISLGVLDTNRGKVAFVTDMSKASAVAISVEPPGGSLVPSSDPIVVANF